MVLRLVSGPTLEKNNGPSADRQKVLLTARLRVLLFLGFLTTRKTGKFSNKVSGIPGFGNSRKIFAGNVFELDYFHIFSDYQHFRFNLCCFENTSVDRVL